MVLGLLLSGNSAFANDKIIMETTHGKVIIELYSDMAPNHVDRIKTLTKQGKYDGVAFHRVIKNFMAQTGDVSNGNLNSNYNFKRAGYGKSNLLDLKAEFNSISHSRGMVSMARGSNKNSANSQFFIVLADSPHLDGQYTVFGKVVEGMQFIDQIKKGRSNGSVKNPDRIISMKIYSDVIAKEKKIKQKEDNRNKLALKFGPECEKNNLVKGTSGYNDCLKNRISTELEKQKALAKKLAAMTPTERHAYNCTETFNFKKATEKFNDCVFKLYTAELDLQKLELEKQVAEAQIKAAANSQAMAEAVANAQIASAKASRRSSDLNNSIKMMKMETRQELR